MWFCINNLQKKKHQRMVGMMNCQIAKHKEEVKRPSQIYTQMHSEMMNYVRHLNGNIIKESVNYM